MTLKSLQTNSATQAALLAVLLFGAIITTLVAPDVVLAATTTADVLTPAADKVSEVTKGSISKIIVGISLVSGLIGCFSRFNVAAIGSCFGVAIAAGVGPGIMESLAGAIF